MMRSDSDLLDSRGTGTEQRPDAFPDLFDPMTFRRLEHLGTGPGWSCWEVGADGATVVSWLAGTVGPTGHVLATAADPSWRTGACADDPVVEVHPYDIATGEPPAEAGFDLVHARLTLSQVADQEAALRTMIRALRPGGRLLVEDTDPSLQPLACPDEHGSAEQLANQVRHACRALLMAGGADLSCGRALPRLLREAGLLQVEADAYFPLASPTCAALETETVQGLRPRLVAENLVSEEDVDRHLANVAEGLMDLAAAPLVAAWGRKG